jgi:hypothetical protein
MRPAQFFWNALTVTGVSVLGASMAAAQVHDAALKAAYIYNFAMFSTWPEAAPKSPLYVCANPGGPLWASLQDINGKSINGRNWTTASLADQKSTRCDVIVLSPLDERPAVPKGGKTGVPVLVVRDGPGRNTAAVTLIDDDEHIRFDVDTEEAVRDGIHFSSRLLRLARNVK